MKIKKPIECEGVSKLLSSTVDIPSLKLYLKDYPTMAQSTTCGPYPCCVDLNLCSHTITEKDAYNLLYIDDIKLCEQTRHQLSSTPLGSTITIPD